MRDSDAGPPWQAVLSRALSVGDADGAGLALDERDEPGLVRVDDHEEIAAGAERLEEAVGLEPRALPDRSLTCSAQINASTSSPMKPETG